MQGLRKDPSTYEPFAPEKVGSDRKLLMCAKIGRREVKDCLEAMGIPLPGGQLGELVGQIRKQAAKYRQPLRESEFLSLVASFHQSNPNN